MKTRNEIIFGTGDIYFVFAAHSGHLLNYFSVDLNGYN